MDALLELNKTPASASELGVDPLRFDDDDEDDDDDDNNDCCTAAAAANANG